MHQVNLEIVKPSDAAKAFIVLIFGAWLGMAPKQISTGGRPILGKICGFAGFISWRVRHKQHIRPRTGYRAAWRHSAE